MTYGETGGEEEPWYWYVVSQRVCVSLFCWSVTRRFSFGGAVPPQVGRDSRGFPSGQRVQQILEEEVWVWDFREET